MMKKSESSKPKEKKRKERSMTKKSESSKPKHYIDGQWVVDLCDNLKTLAAAELDLKKCRPVCICEVPESLSCSKREAFIPQFVGLGPYHHYNDGLIMTKDKKLKAAKRVLKYLQPQNIEEFEQRISNFGPDILTFYHPDVISTYNQFTLSYIITIDALFLLGFITLLNGHNPDDVGFSYFITGHLGVPQFNSAGLELTKNALVREVFKLENQIPFHLLKLISGAHAHEIQSDAQDVSPLGSYLQKFCQIHCPFLPAKLPENKAPETYDHLLDLMYHFIVPKPILLASQIQTETKPKIQSQTETQSQTQSETETQKDTQTDSESLTETETKTQCQSQTQTETQTQCQSQTQTETETQTETQQDPESKPEPESEPKPETQPKNNRGCLFSCFSIFFNIILYLVVIFVILGMVIKHILKLFWRMICGIYRLVRWLLCSLYGQIKDKLPVLAEHLKTGLEWVQEGLTEAQRKYPNVAPLTWAKDVVGRLIAIVGMLLSGESDDGVSRAVMIPSVTELHEAGISFQSDGVNVSSIKFDEEKCVLSLPCITVNTNTEVIIRNLVAYETLIKSSNPLVFTRYVELMRAIIDTPQDVKLLVENHIIDTQLRNEVVADLFNGMSKAIRDTKAKDLDEVIKKVNAKYKINRKRKRAVSKYTSGSFLTAIGGLVFLTFTAFQTYCTVYNCSGTYKLAKMPQPGEYATNNYLISSM